MLTNSMQPEEGIGTHFPFLEMVAPEEPFSCRWLPFLAGRVVIQGWVWR
jgi:hypothetical protein